MDHTVQRLRVKGDETGVDVEGFTFNDEFEGDRCVDTARSVRNVCHGKAKTYLSLG